MHGCCTQVDALLDSQNARARKLVLQHTDKILALSEHLSKHKVRVCFVRQHCLAAAAADDAWQAGHQSIQYVA
jgi:hypothetical protein